MGTMMYWWWGDHMAGWGWTLMLVGNLVFLGLLAGGLVALLRLARFRIDRPRPAPHELLAERFARGEIDEAEYRRRSDVLNDTVPRRPSGSG
jgi:putative membrane protein